MKSRAFDKFGAEQPATFTFTSTSTSTATTSRIVSNCVFFVLVGATVFVDAGVIVSVSVIGSFFACDFGALCP